MEKFHKNNRELLSEVLRVSYLLQDFKFSPKCLGYLRATAEADQRCSRKSVLIILIKLVVLCDRHLSLMRSYLYSSLLVNTIKSGRSTAYILFRRGKETTRKTET
jgi:hypothetical protein